MFWGFRKAMRQYSRRFFRKTDYDRALHNYAAGRLAYYMIAWTIGTFTFMHLLFHTKDVETGEGVWVEPKDVKYLGVPGYELSGFSIKGGKIERRKIKSAIDDDN